MTLDANIRAALISFYSDVASGTWSGREREMVSLFTFAHLLRQVGTGVLLDPAQIGIEVAVSQISDGVKRKRSVCKDLVIWHQPKQTRWSNDGDQEPLAIMEWKVVRDFNIRTRVMLESEFATDIQWLNEKAKSTTGEFFGYAVFVDTSKSPAHLRCTRIVKESIDNDWLGLPARIGTQEL